MTKNDVAKLDQMIQIANSMLRLVEDSEIRMWITVAINNTIEVRNKLNKEVQ